MRIIFSRKGFDSSAGGTASPLIDGRPVSLPIPTRMPTPTCYRDLPDPIPRCVRDLTRGRIVAARPCHLDPDLVRDSLPRTRGWRGALGQTGSAQAHLRNQGVGVGDLFLFWGLFRPVAYRAQWRYVGAREHRLFGWLQVGAVVEVPEDPSGVLARWPWLATHPHVRTGWHARNTLYLARKRLDIGGVTARRPGWGVFSRGLRITADASIRPSTWAVPAWLNPALGGVGLSYHRRERWTAAGELRVVGRGQEFVADVGDRSDVRTWLDELFEIAG
jgi:hypothetical protein